MDRRNFNRSGVALGAVSALCREARSADEPARFAFASPPVVQTPLPDSVAISWETGGLADCMVEWGYDRNLGFKAKPSHHGLVELDDRFTAVRIDGIEKKRIFYRIVARKLTYRNAYRITPGPPIRSNVFSVNLPDADAETFSMTVVNDTHDKAVVLDALIERVNAIKPDYHLWDGDLCDAFNSEEQLARICLCPGTRAKTLAAGGWAASRPLLLVPGNHDVRGRHAGAIVKAMPAWPMDRDEPQQLNRSCRLAGRYCFALRHGPVAVIGLDTGEDKPDRHPVFAGLADYEDYRRAQKAWLMAALKRPEIRSAPFLIAACHIPLRGLKGHNDGQTLKGYAYYSGQGQAEWLRLLADAGCRAVISGHTHRWRIQKPSDDWPVYQITGGGPTLAAATVIRVDAAQDALRISVENLQANTLGQVTFKRGS